MSNNIPLVVGELVEAVTANTWARGYLRKTTAKTVNGTTTATDLLNGEFTLPAGALGTDKILRLTAWGDWKNDASLDYDHPRFQVVFGGATRLDTGGTAGESANAATRYGWRIVCEIQNLGAANSQWWTIQVISGATVTTAGWAAFITGNGTSSMDVAAPVTMIGGNTGTVDTTASCALALKVINANGSGNYETKLYGALVEVI